MSTASEEKLIRHLPIDTTHRFHQVKSLDSMILVYAAIWQGDNVRIVALKTLGEDIKNLSCVFFRSLKVPSPSFTAAALVSDIPEHHDYQHTAASITCPVQRQTSEQLRFVGLTNQTHFPPTWLLPVEALETGQESDENKEELAPGDGMYPLEQNVGLSVCVPAMYGFKNAAQLVEKIEMSRLLGAGRVVFYNYSISFNVDAVLRMYARDWSQGRDKLEVKVYPWHLPEFEQSGKKKQLSIHYLGQMAAIDHCLHRYRQFSQFIIFSDMDEFAVPLQHNSLYELVAERQKMNSSRMGFLFQSSVFNKDRPSPALGFETDALRYGSAVLGLTSRDNFYFPENVRSKVMVDPKKVDVMGIHYIFEGSGITDIVPLEQGFLAHYREPLNNCKPGVVDSRVVDRFGKRLAARLRKVWSRLKNVSLGWEPFKKKDSKRC
ncbi:hypothetical protein RRG08_040550 [Elysia crispata]|uniref:Glycosyltransferase family 92 protein n=1 Tax=Elysia crispata TaxID=231223 RepID=A0AAE0Z834_9GAST|nr:hypothetical protein RRG08_040550 [Elysia crispata]